MNAATATETSDLKIAGPEVIDSYAEHFDQLKRDLVQAKTELKAKQDEVAIKELFLIELVKAHGGPYAEKSKILHGIVWEMVATFGQYTVQDAAAVERFRLGLAKAKQTRLLKKIFKADVRYTMQASASEIVKTEKLSPKLMALLLQCSDTQNKKPSLDVRPKKKA